jgi:hypothetical protein
MRLLTLILCTLSWLPLAQAQYGDCATAKEICNKDRIRFTPRGPGSSNREADLVICFMSGTSKGQAEINSAWIKFEIKESGTFLFTATPDVASDDLDFVVFRLQNNGDCKTKQVVRCMASGETQGMPSERCMGATGLRSNERESSEDSGCNDPDDNAWLAPLRVSKGEHYAIMISNMTAPRSFSVSFSGTAQLFCEKEEKPIAKKEEPKKKEEKSKPKTEPKPEPKPTAPVAEAPKKNDPPKAINGREVEVGEVVKVKNRTIKVKVWDSQVEDGDVISIYIGEEKVLDHYRLTKAPKEFVFNLPATGSEHYLTVYADDFGQKAPNTATLIIDDGNNNPQQINLSSDRKKQESVKIITN